MRIICFDDFESIGNQEKKLENWPVVLIVAAVTNYHDYMV